MSQKRQISQITMENISPARQDVTMNEISVGKPSNVDMLSIGQSKALPFNVSQTINMSHARADVSMHTVSQQSTKKRKTD